MSQLKSNIKKIVDVNYQCLKCHAIYNNRQEAVSCCGEISIKCAICGIDSSGVVPSDFSKFKTKVGYFCEICKTIEPYDSLNIFVCNKCFIELSKKTIPDFEQF